MPALALPPLSLYIHIPWCVRKCPYCDFNSHEVRDEIPVAAYVNALREDLLADAAMAQGREITSIFFGGGTPSLFPAQAIGEILSHVNAIVGIAADAEITLEANPGTVEHHSFADLRACGVNRLSIGVQSFHDNQLKTLGRIHAADEAIAAIKRAQTEGFDNINIDLMHGLPEQSLSAAQADLEQAIALAPQHISWYQLTIEQNTEFFSKPPRLPEEETLLEIMDAGMALLDKAGFAQYEVSAFARPGRSSQHNLNYWRFGDYMAIGAGAHGKITYADRQTIERYRKTRLPKDYLDSQRSFTAGSEAVHPENLPLEFMMNALRLNAGCTPELFEARCGLPSDSLDAPLDSLRARGLIEPGPEIRPTALGRRFLNSILEAFL